jgi:zinc and cadmium transporter
MAGVVLGAGLVLALGPRRAALTPSLLAFAAGTLLGAALLALLPEAAAGLPLPTVSGLMLLAIVVFFLLERWLLWWHSHEGKRERHSVAGYLILVGDGLHNVVDGVALGAAFAASPALGVVVGVAMLAHEVPQEVGDFVLLLESGLSNARALVYNLATAAAVFPGVVAGYLLAEAVEPAMAVVLALAAGAFLYVALADLIPDLHRRGQQEMLRYQLGPLLAGIVLIWLLDQIKG